MDAHTVGLAAPDLNVSPSRVWSSLLTGGTQTHTLTLSNLGDDTLHFTIPPPQILTAVLTNPPLQPKLEHLSKNEPDTRVGAPVLANSGGPDAFGWTSPGSAPCSSWTATTSAPSPLA